MLTAGKIGQVCTSVKKKPAGWRGVRSSDVIARKLFLREPRVVELVRPLRRRVGGRGPFLVCTAYSGTKVFACGIIAVVIRL